MEFSELLKARRSVRSFEDKAVPLELIQEIIKGKHVLTPKAEYRLKLNE